MTMANYRSAIVVWLSLAGWDTRVRASTENGDKSAATLSGLADDMCRFGVHIKTDDWPLETGWDVYDEKTGERIAWANEGTYAGENKMYNTYTDVPPGKYKLVVTDSFGDGLNGWYKTTNNGNMVHESDGFDGDEDTSFFSCGLDTCVLTVNIVEDKYAVCDTSWEVILDETGSTALAGDFQRLPMRNPGAIESSDTSITVIHGEEYTFTIFDSYGDGLCCDYGQGSYSVEVAGNEVASGDEFGYVETHKILVDCGGGTDQDDSSIESGATYLIRLYDTNMCWQTDSGTRLRNGDKIVLAQCNTAVGSQHFAIKDYSSGVYEIITPASSKWHVIGINPDPDASGSQGKVRLSRLSSGVMDADAEVWNMAKIKDGSGAFGVWLSGVHATNQDGNTASQTPVVLRTESRIKEDGGEMRWDLLKQ